MLFSSVIFLFYFLPIVLILYYLTRGLRMVQNIILLFASLIFYAWGEPRFVILMIISIIFNYIFGILIHYTLHNKQLCRWVLIICVIGNIGNLFYFKYLTFVLNNLNINLVAHLNIPEIVLPIGISFYTFQAMSYVIDVYRQTAKVQKNLFYLGLHICLFPQLVAGPIVQYTAIMYQLTERKETWRKFSVGCSRFIMGLSKKILISNNMAVVADQIFTMNTNGDIPLTLAWLGAIAYTLQIYFDFSAYSDMAIGLGLMFGFEFEENFNFPYISKSIGEFWRRWHISLNTWFKDYVYFPLGGSRVSNKDKLIRNLFVVWALTGIWHGANWTFLIWGLLNFVFNVFERLINFEQIKKYIPLKHVYTMFIVIIGWVIFRAEDLQAAGHYIISMFGAYGLWSDYSAMFVKEFGLFFVLGILFSMPVTRRANLLIVDNSFPILSRAVSIIYPFVLLVMFTICVIYLVKGSYNPFIYFNF